MKVALFRSLNFDSCYPWEMPGPLSDEYVQMSGWIEVDFPPMTPGQQAYAQKIIVLYERQRMAEKALQSQKAALKAERAALDGGAQ